MRYRRAFIPGGSFFFTLVTEKRRPLLASAEAVDVLRQAFRTVKAARPFDLDAIVVLPDHLHCIWTMPQDDADFATRWRLIKTWFTKHCNPALRSGPDQLRHDDVALRQTAPNATYKLNPSRVARKQQMIWQHRYWEHTLRDETDFSRHFDYIHYNPVKHGHVSSAREWPYSSFRRYVAEGIYAMDWGGSVMNFEEVGNE